MRRLHPIVPGRASTAATATVLAVALGTGALTPATAQAPGQEIRDTLPDTIPLPELVVTATRVPLPVEALPVPVTVLAGADLRAQGVETVAEALRQVPGAVVTRSGAPGAQTSLFLRGGESDYVKVLIDGVPVNDPGGAFDLADLSTHNVQRIEVLRGPGSVLYGSDAVAGVVHVFTRRGAGDTRATLQATGGRGEQRYRDGSYGTADVEGALSGAAGPVGYSIGGERSWSEGLYPFNSARDLTSASGRVSWSPAPGSEVAVSTRWSDSRSRFPTDGTGALTDRNAYIDRQHWTTSVAGGIPLHERVDARVRVGYTTRVQESIDRADGPADTTGTYATELAWDVTRRLAEARVNVDLPRSVLTGGVAWEDAVAETRYASDSQWGPTTAEEDYDRSNTGYFMQLLTEPLERVHLTLGGRIDDNEAYGTFETYRLGAAIEPLDGTRVRAAVGRAFREPTFDENFGSGFGDRGNPALEPERSRSWEVGADQEVTGALTLGATWFDQRFEDLIQYTFTAPEPDAPNYFNVGAARARGLELTAGALLRQVDLRAGYTWLDAEVLDPGLATDQSFVEGEPLLRRPTHSGTFSARYTAPDGQLGGTLNVVGERDDLDFAAGFPAPRVVLPAYATLDLSAEHGLPISGPDTRILLRVENVLDARYETISGFPAPGRLVRLGVRLEL